MKINWSSYFQSLSGQPPRETLTRALAVLGTRKGFAVDLGCGSGMDSLELLRLGWRVLAVDQGEEALAWLLASVGKPVPAELETRLSDFSDIVLPPADLINASYSLPFMSEEEFPYLWEEIRAAIQPGGCFAGHFFGVKDTWPVEYNALKHTEEQVRALFSDFEIHYFHEEDKDGFTVDGGPKHWHIYHLVAQKHE